MRVLKMKFLFLLFFLSLTVFSQSWHSKLYPENWTPGYSDDTGHYLQDFSFAGYHSGLDELPIIQSKVIDVTQSPYNADCKGVHDATESIQKALDDVGLNGGGVVFLPAGEYLLSVPQDRKFGLLLKYNNVVLRGAGASKTRLKCSTANLREKAVLSIRSENGSWKKTNGKPSFLIRDVIKPADSIPVEDFSQFKVGDRVMVTCDAGAGFVAEHKCTDYWIGIDGPMFSRVIKGIDPSKKCIILDEPTRYFLKTRDLARVYKLNPQVIEVGLEDFSIGNIENAEFGWGDLDFNVPGTGAYEVHNSHLIAFTNAENCWARSISTYKPAENRDEYCVLSNCMLLSESRYITIQDCNFKNTQYKGEGGNGYLFTLMGNDCLIKNCSAENGRHNYDFKFMKSNGNVILKCKSKDPRLASDFHMQLSMANLFDGFIADGDYVDASFRPYGTAKRMHMYTTTQTVIWNTTGLKDHNKGKGFLVESCQFGNGYVIGTSGKISEVRIRPVSGTIKEIYFDTGEEDYVEGVGKGESLVPQSLYIDQLQKRKERILNQKK